MSAQPEQYSLGLDIGGTFTDFVLVSNRTGETIVFKYPTTYPDPADGAINGLDELLEQQHLDSAQVVSVVHATTLVTNAIIEARGAKVGLLYTAGFPNVLDLRKEQRYDAYDLRLAYPEPLIPLNLRRPVVERMSRDGDILQAPASSQVLEVVAELVAKGVEGLALCFLHAYRNDANERYVANLIREQYPRLHLSLSCDVAPLIGEWERTSTVAADAYVRPLVDRYLQRLDAELASRSMSDTLYLTLSNGGTASTGMGREYPVRLLESGPAAGVLAASFYGELTHHPNILVFDMGGTTAKACVIHDGQPAVTEELEVARVSRFRKGSGLPIRTPSLELLEIGAGGGSIAWVHDLGTLRVGPQSAGSNPGPACYGWGGELPTVTDANLHLGYYDPTYFVGGRMTLRPDLATNSLAELGTTLGLSPTETAWGIQQVVNENMASAARIHVIERGYDPRNFSIVAFGGGGPTHGTAIARILGASQVIVPLAAGATAALGGLTAPFSFHMVQTRVARLSYMDWDGSNTLLGAMEERGRTLLLDAGADVEAIRIERSADMRMVGQYHEVRVPLPGGTLDETAVATIYDTFASVYRSKYSYLQEGVDLEIVNWHVQTLAYVPKVTLKRHDLEDMPDPSPALKGWRDAFFGEQTGYISSAVYDRYRLVPGMVISGPAFVEERESTTVLRPGDVAMVDEYFNLLVKVES